VVRDWNLGHLHIECLSKYVLEYQRSAKNMNEMNQDQNSRIRNKIEIENCIDKVVAEG